MKRLRAPITAFFLTLCLLCAAGGALRADYVTRRTLHGDGSAFRAAALHDAADHAADTAEPFLPKRIALGMTAFRRMVTVVADKIRI